MSDAVARDYVGRPDAERRNELLRRDYVGGTRTVTVDHSKTTTTGGKSRLIGLAVSFGIAGTVGWLVYSNIANELAGQTVTFTQPEPSMMAVPLVLMLGCAFLVAAAMGVVPGIAQMPRMGMGGRP